MEDKSQLLGGAKPESVTAKSSAVGLDIGTSRIVLADGPSPKDTQSQLNAFVTVPYSKMAEDVLKQKSMVYDRNGKDLYVYGNDSDFFASFMNTVPRRPMSHGVLNAQEKMSQHILRDIIQKIIPRSRKGEVLCFSVPGAGEGAKSNLVYHEAILKNLLQQFGYTAKGVNEGLAVVLSELQDENFTGIGISFGGGMCNVCVSFMSMPMITFSIPKGGDYIDQSVSDVLNETSTRVRLMKEETLDLSRQPRDEISSALHIYYDDVLQTLISRLREELEGSRHLPTLDRPIPVVLSGGTAKPSGFQQKFESLLKSADLPIQIADIRMAKDPLTATAIGCYVAAMAETR
jgi:actin-like ATPase involved in cell morphogenesis